jgi:cytochrome c oxidase assembly protein subunit 11
MNEHVSNQPSSHAGARRHARVAGKMLLLTVTMFGFGYLMVPMYNIICDITGLNGKTGRVSVAEADASKKLNEERQIIVEFTSNVNQSGSWIFRPDVKSMVVKPGVLYHASYYAENLMDASVTAQATPSVTPFTAAKYFNKTECFCFVQQLFEPLGSMHMPLTFVIDPDIPVNIDRVTLSYTFFRSPDQS